MAIGKILKIAWCYIKNSTILRKINNKTNG